MQITKNNKKNPTLIMKLEGLVRRQSEVGSGKGRAKVGSGKGKAMGNEYDQNISYTCMKCHNETHYYI